LRIKVADDMAPTCPFEIDLSSLDDVAEGSFAAVTLLARTIGVDPQSPLIGQRRRAVGSNDLFGAPFMK